MKFPVINGICKPHALICRLSGHHRREGGKDEGVRSGGGLGKHYVLDITGSLNSWSLCSCGSLHETCTGSSQSAFQPGRKRGAPFPKLAEGLPTVSEYKEKQHQFSSEFFFFPPVSDHALKEVPVFAYLGINSLTQ